MSFKLAIYKGRSRQGYAEERARLKAQAEQGGKRIILLAPTLDKDEREG